MHSGDIESNPGPMAKVEAETFASVVDRISKPEEAHAALVAELKNAKKGEAAALVKVTELEQGNVQLHAEIKSRKDELATAKSKIGLLNARVTPPWSTRPILPLEPVFCRASLIGS